MAAAVVVLCLHGRLYTPHHPTPKDQVSQLPQLPYKRDTATTTQKQKPSQAAEAIAAAINRIIINVSSVD